jgi:hypothetical protein
MSMRQLRDRIEAGYNFQMPPEVSRSDVDLQAMLGADNTSVFLNRVMSGFQNMYGVYNPASRSVLRQYTDAASTAYKGLGGISDVVNGLSRAQNAVSKARKAVAGDAEMERYLDFLADPLLASARTNRENLVPSLEQALRSNTLGFAQSISGLDPRAQAPLLKILAGGATFESVRANRELYRASDGKMGLNFFNTSPYGGTFEEARNFNQQLYAALAGSVEARGAPAVCSPTG